MKVVKSDTTNHIISGIPRYYGFSNTTLTLTSLANNIDETVTHTIALYDGVMEISFSYQFVKRQKFTLKIEEGAEVVYRCQLFCTDQETQDFDITKNYYSYG